MEGGGVMRGLTGWVDSMAWVVAGMVRRWAKATVVKPGRQRGRRKGGCGPGEPTGLLGRLGGLGEKATGPVEEKEIRI
jgi:hypothetical protein